VFTNTGDGDGAVSANLGDGDGAVSANRGDTNGRTAPCPIIGATQGDGSGQYLADARVPRGARCR